MKVEWIALFKDDLTSKYFSKPIESESVKYWIECAEDGRNSPITYAGNTKPLKTYKVFDSNLIESTLSPYTGWVCTDILETSYDARGHVWHCTISDTMGEYIRIYIDGFYSRHGANGFTPNLGAHLLISSIYVYLLMCGNYKTWDEMRKSNPTLYSEVSKSIPQNIYRYLHQREELTKQVYYQKFNKL